MSANGLIMHAGGKRVERSELALIPTPEPTKTYMPVPHLKAAELVVAETARRGYQIAAEEYGLSKDGSKMFGVLRFNPDGRPDMTRCLGFRNSHDKTLAFGLTVGVRVLVCDNLAFGGEETFRRKHTSCLDIVSMIPDVFNKLTGQFKMLEERIDCLKACSISIDDARVMTVMAAELKAIPSCDIVQVLDTFRNPPHE